MEKSVSKTLSISQHEQNNNQLIDLILLDEVTNIQYVLKVEKKVYNRAHNDTLNTGNQCNNKMDALKRRYRQIVDHNAQSGNDRKDWIYLDVLDNIFRKKHWIKPLSVAGSNIKEPEHSPLTDNSDENETPVKQRKISLTEARANYLTLSLEEKRLKRKETANYRATKLQILREIKEALGKQKQ
ncbi:uncharacterized protein [Linepithema humile]|uniref:uncharacterized protein isoform X5 n=1 Tax=Linepithema humile TaxID=83485 RepID=UPI00351E392F